MILCILKTIDIRKIFNHKVVQNLILNNFVIKSFVKILLVWPLLGGVFISCYYGDQNAMGNRTNYCEFIYMIFL